MRLLNKTILTICLLLAAITAHADDNVLAQVLDGYNTSWQQIGIDGKLKMQGLPLGIKPSMKIYMQRDQVVRISVRAPLMGEVAVIEIDNNQMLVVNKMKNCYCTLPMWTVTEMCGLTLPNIQDMLLARIFCVGSDKVKPSQFDVYKDPQNGFVGIVPKKQNSQFNYGFVLDNNLSLLGTLFEMNGSTLTFSYKYDKGNKMVTDIELKMPNHSYTASLEYSNISYNPSVLKPFELTNKYKQVSPKQLF